jgi:2-iminobutanoate/2-iminopropanoate deaminase
VSAEYFPIPGNSRLPFSEAVRVGNMLYLAGAMGFDMATMTLVPGGVEAETRKTIENIKATLERHGSSLDRVVKATVFLADMSEWDKMNAVYVTYFTKHLPARSAFGGVSLARGGRVEIEVIATCDG